MSNLNRMDWTSRERRRALRLAEREDMLRVVGSDKQAYTPDANALAANSRDGRHNDDPRSHP